MNVFRYMLLIVGMFILTVIADARLIPDGLLDSLRTSEELQRYDANRRKAMELDKFHHRPTYHFTSPESILHDPNGLCIWNGRQATMLRTWPVLPESTTVSVRTLAGPTSVIKAEAWKMRPINPSIME